MDKKFDLDPASFKLNEMLNLQYIDLNSLISVINQSDAPNSTTIDKFSLAANYDPNEYDIYLQNNFNNSETNSNVKKSKNILLSPFRLDINKCIRKDSKTANDICVKYGRGWILKNSDAYHDMRKRNNQAIHKCRKNKAPNKVIESK
jgi:hypothetical protein